MKRLLTFISLILCLCATSLAQDVKVSGPKKRSTNNKPQVKSEANKAQTQNTSVQDRQIEGPDSWFYEGYKYDQANDYVQAVLWYRKAAEKGHLKSQFRLGLIYMQGMGNIEQNFSEATKWLRLASEAGYGDAQYMLGYAYWALFENPNEAERLLRMAISQGNKDAQKILNDIIEKTYCIGAFRVIKLQFELALKSNENLKHWYDYKNYSDCEKRLFRSHLDIWVKVLKTNEITIDDNRIACSGAHEEASWIDQNDCHITDTAYQQLSAKKKKDYIKQFCPYNECAEYFATMLNNFKQQQYN